MDPCLISSIFDLEQLCFKLFICCSGMNISKPNYSPSTHLNKKVIKTHFIPKQSVESNLVVLKQFANSPFKFSTRDILFLDSN